MLLCRDWPMIDSLAKYNFPFSKAFKNILRHHSVTIYDVIANNTDQFSNLTELCLKNKVFDRDQIKEFKKLKEQNNKETHSSNLITPDKDKAKEQEIKVSKNNNNNDKNVSKNPKKKNQKKRTPKTQNNWQEHSQLKGNF